jgi:hypothetical protein
MMPGQSHRKPGRRLQDVDHVYEAATAELAETLGWDHLVIYDTWAQLALCREYHGGSRVLSEFLAWQDVITIFNCTSDPN